MTGRQKTLDIARDSGVACGVLDKDLSSNNANLPPGDDGARKVEQCDVAGVCFLVSYQDLAESIEPRMRRFHHPSTRAVCGVRGFLGTLFAAGPDVGYVAPVHHGLTGARVVIPFIGAQPFRSLCPNRRPTHDNTIQNRLQLRHVVPVCSGDDEGQRDATAVDKNVTLCAHFSPGPWGCARRTLVPTGPSSWPNPCSAMPTRCPPSRRTRPSRLPKVVEKTPGPPISGNTRGWNWGFRISPLAALSIGILYATRTRCLQTLCADPGVSAHLPASAGRFAMDPVQVSGSTARRVPKTRRKPPRNGPCPSSSSSRKGTLSPARKCTRSAGGSPLFTDKP